MLLLWDIVESAGHTSGDGNLVSSLNAALELWKQS